MFPCFLPPSFPGPKNLTGGRMQGDGPDTGRLSAYHWLSQCTVTLSLCHRLNWFPKPATAHVTLTGGNWLNTIVGTNWLNIIVGTNWLSTIGGTYWLNIILGTNWLNTIGWTDWLNIIMGTNWLNTIVGTNWLNIIVGHNWLNTMGGLTKLLHGPQFWLCDWLTDMIPSVNKLFTPCVINRPCLARVVLQSPSSLIHSFIHSLIQSSLRSESSRNCLSQTVRARELILWENV